MKSSENDNEVFNEIVKMNNVCFFLNFINYFKIELIEEEKKKREGDALFEMHKLPRINK